MVCSQQSTAYGTWWKHYLFIAEGVVSTLCLAPTVIRSHHSRCALCHICTTFLHFGQAVRKAMTSGRPDKQTHPNPSAAPSSQEESPNTIPTMTGKWSQPHDGSGAGPKSPPLGALDFVSLLLGAGPPGSIWRLVRSGRYDQQTGGYNLWHGGIGHIS